MRTSATLFPLTCLLVACGGGGSSDSPATGSLSLAITDAPVDEASAVVVEFTGLTIKPAAGNEIHFPFTTPRSIDLLQLTGNASEALIVNESVPAGNYSWIRLEVNAEQDAIMDSYITTPGGQYELRIPSGSQTGLQLGTGFVVAAGGSSNFTLDFDLRKSVVAPPGQQPAYLLKPSLRLIDNLLTGTITGTVDPTLVSVSCAGDANSFGAVYLYSPAIDVAIDTSTDAGPLTTALVSEVDFSYEIGFVEAGSDYSIAYTCDNGLDDPETVEQDMVFSGLSDVTVTAGEVEEIDFVIE